MSKSDTESIISSVTFASTVVSGVMEKPSIDGAVFCTSIEVLEDIGAPSLSEAEAVQTISSVGLVVFGSMVNVFPTAASGVPSSKVHE